MQGTIQQTKTTSYPNTFQTSEPPGKCRIILSGRIIQQLLVFDNYSNCVKLLCRPGFFTSGKLHPPCNCSFFFFLTLPI